MPGRAISQSFISSLSNSAVKNGARRFANSLRASRFSGLAAQPTLLPANLVVASTHTSSTVLPSTSSPTDFAWQRQLSELQESLSNNGKPSRVWANYTNLLNGSGFNNLPLEVHQQVLRKCTPPVQQLRISAARRLLVGNTPQTPHIHEGRFQTIIRHIRSSGHEPTLDDYHFILSQFAAVGHYTGSMQVYQELIHIGHTPTSKTIGLCLQAIAHRFTLPIYKKDRQSMIEQTRKIFSDLLTDMRKYGTPLSSVNMDLAIRILKENVDLETFESLMRWAYGIDLSYPDKAPLELMESKLVPPQIEGANMETAPANLPLPFSTAALNTTIDILGRLGSVSKMVQAFEVLTQPLPHAQEHFFSTFDDDEDDAGAILNIAPAFTPPYAIPNTTTYNTLLRHVSRAGHATFARHYLNQAMRLDREVDRALRHQIWKKRPFEEIESPNFSINRGTVIPLLGESNRDKNLGLMRWLSSKMARIIRKKRDDVEFYKSKAGTASNTSEPTMTSPLSSIESHSSPQPTQPSSPLPALDRKPRPHSGSVFDLDLDSTAGPSVPTTKKFSIQLHIQILERDVRELQEFAKYLEDILGRTTQRVKERLGRRVWAEKDIWLLTTRLRGSVSREEWTEMVGFRPRRHPELPNLGEDARVGTRNRLKTGTWTRGQPRTPMASRYAQRRSFSTSFVGFRSLTTPASPPEPSWDRKATWNTRRS